MQRRIRLIISFAEFHGGNAEFHRAIRTMPLFKYRNEQKANIWVYTDQFPGNYTGVSYRNIIPLIIFFKILTFNYLYHDR
jgi:hypothetical protein